tara:strand:- start:304 stop:672 length:369 start_codon:yes stop_codon:yes gene_type:complete
MNKQEFIKNRVDSIKWYEEKRRNKNNGTMGEVKIYAQSYYDQYKQHIGTIDYDYIDGTWLDIQPVIQGKNKYYYYNCDKMEYFKTFEEAKKWSKNQYIKSVKLKANWEFKKKEIYNDRNKNM